MIKHTFHLTYAGTQFGEKIQFETLSAQFKNIEIIPLEGMVSQLIIGIENADSIEDSYQKAEFKANDLVDRLALIFNDVVELDYFGNSEDDGLSAKLKGKMSLTASCTVTVGNAFNHFHNGDNLKAFSNDHNAGAKRVYRHTHEISDDISRYLIFYGLLQILINKKQKVIDKQIKIYLPEIEIVEGYDGKDETIITRTRNLIAHPESLDMEQISSLVNKNIEPLRKIVVKTLLNNGT